MYVQQPVPATVPVTFVDDVRLTKTAAPATFIKTVWATWAGGKGKAHVDVTNLGGGGGGGGGGGKGRRMLTQ